MNMQAFPNPRTGEADQGLGGLALTVLSTAAEICEAAPQAQASGFFRSIGRRMAALEPLEGVSDSDVLAARINAFWKALGWGEAEFVIAETGIRVVHRGLPNRIAPDPHGHWANMLLGLLEGAYDSWFRQLGSGPALHTSAQWKGDTVEIRHGR